MRWVQLYGGFNILWHCLSLGLEWKLTFSSPVATAEFSKFAGILSAALSQHHLLGFEISPSPVNKTFDLFVWKAGIMSLICFPSVYHNSPPVEKAHKIFVYWINEWIDEGRKEAINFRVEEWHMKTLLEENESSRHVRKWLLIIISNIVTWTSKSMYYVSIFVHNINKCY